jgi:hypothetical protein
MAVLSRPQLQRAGWELLDGPWDFALDPDAAWTHPRQVTFDATITVPFAPETPASGIAHDGFLRRCFYRRSIAVPPTRDDERVLVHFGAVDREAHVWANGQLVAHHVGGYTPFAADITDVLAAGGSGGADEEGDGEGDGDRIVELLVVVPTTSRHGHHPGASRTGGPSRTSSGTSAPPGSGRAWVRVPAVHPAALRWSGISPPCASPSTRPPGRWRWATPCACAAPRRPGAH